MHKQYEPELRSFALTLHFYSPQAYAFVRQKFDTCLLHPKTICKCYKSVNGEPGFNAEALKSIKQRAELVNYPLFGVLIFDEMAIRRHVEYDGQKFIGYVDLGPDIDCGNAIAKEALVFLVNMINQSLKIPIGYFLINGLNAEQKSNLVIEALKTLHEHYINIIARTFDGTPVNLTMCNILGCNLTSTFFQTYFFHPTTQQKVVVFLDPCHALKLLRNYLGNHKSMIDYEGNIIRWEYFMKLHEIQTNEGLHLANKLRTQHVNYQTQKMKVKLAAQIFSSSVADAIDFCKNDLKYSEFANSTPTTRFIRLINDLFDIFNSINMKQKGFKQPLHKNNSSIIINKLNEGYDYLAQLRTTKNNSLLIQSRSKCGVIGFMMCIKSLLEIYNNLVVSQDILQYIPCYKFSQDHIELFFGCIRAKGGCNNNPTVRQFKAAYKKLLIHTEIANIKTGNCIPLDAIAILHISSNPEKIINQSTPTSRLFENSSCEDNNNNLQ